VFVNWWAVYYPGAEPAGGGFIAQRMLAAKDEKHARAGTLWFTFAHYCIRPWPWILVGLSALALEPRFLDSATHGPDFAAEKAYPWMFRVLPVGMLGLVVASFFAAFMSTLCSLLNLSASYVVNDFYMPFLAGARLGERGQVLAARLRAEGVKPGQLVAVVLEKGWLQVVATLAILESGAAYLPVDPAVPADRLKYLLEHSEVRIALTSPALEASLAWPACVEVCIAQYHDPGAAPWTPLDPVAGQGDLAYVMYTSGSTGLPKGVEIDHRGAVNTILDINRRFGVTGNDRVLALSSLSFDLSVWDIFGLLAAGGTIVFPDAASRRDPEHWRELVRGGVTIWNSAPALMRLLMEACESRSEGLGESLRLVMMSGDWIAVDLPERIRALSSRAGGPEVVSLGGATEASIWSVFFPIGGVDPAWKSIPYGRPLANQALHVLDHELMPRPDWVAGDLYIEGVGLARGYWRDPPRTQSAFIEHPRTGKRLYRTGDLARYRSDGELEFLGREDAQVKVNGYRVELGEIETHLQAHPLVRQAVCVAQGERDQARRLVAGIVPETTVPPDAESLRVFLARRLPEYLIPSAFITLERVPLGSNGKVDRAAVLRVASQLAPSAESVGGPGPPSDPVTQRLVELIRSELQLETLTPETNLLNVGVSSLDMLRVINEVETHLGFRPKVEEFFMRPSIAGLVELHSRWMRGEAVGERSAGSLSAAPDLALTPEERETLKRGELALRQFGPERRRLRLGTAEFSAMTRMAFAARRSYRDFDESALLPLSSLAETLACLRRLDAADGARRMYASANGLYPVQIYLSVKPSRVEGLEGGTYYFGPHTGDLTLITPGAGIADDIHVPYNQRVARASAFSVFLIAAMDAIRPLYGDLSERLVLIEAGLMTELLDLTGPSNGIGFCQIGSVAFEDSRALFELDAQHLLVHTLLGGAVAGLGQGVPGTAMQSAERDSGSV